MFLQRLNLQQIRRAVKKLASTNLIFLEFFTHWDQNHVRPPLHCPKTTSRAILHPQRLLLLPAIVLQQSILLSEPLWIVWLRAQVDAPQPTCAQMMCREVEVDAIAATFSTQLHNNQHVCGGGVLEGVASEQLTKRKRRRRRVCVNIITFIWKWLDCLMAVWQQGNTTTKHRWQWRERRTSCFHHVEAYWLQPINNQPEKGWIICFTLCCFIIYV